MNSDLKPTPSGTNLSEFYPDRSSPVVEDRENIEELQQIWKDFQTSSSIPLTSPHARSASTTYQCYSGASPTNGKSDTPVPLRRVERAQSLDPNELIEVTIESLENELPSASNPSNRINIYGHLGVLFEQTEIPLIEEIMLALITVPSISTEKLTTQINNIITQIKRQISSPAKQAASEAFFPNSPIPSSIQARAGWVGQQSLNITPQAPGDKTSKHPLGHLRHKTLSIAEEDIPARGQATAQAERKLPPDEYGTELDEGW